MDPARPVLFFGGKGGVGKTTLAAAYAVLSADGGTKTLLVSTDPAHSTGDVLAHRLGAAPGEVLPNLHALEIDPEREADRYISGVKERIREAAPAGVREEAERQIDAARVTPGAAEAAVFERVCELLELAGKEYGRVIFDTAPTGHTLRLLSLPELMGAWVEALVSRRRQANAFHRAWRRLGGAKSEEGAEPDPVLEALERRRERFRRAREVVTDAKRAAFVFVVVPERLPILETCKAVQLLKRYGVPVDKVIVNRVIPAHADGAFVRRRRKREATYLAEIDRRFGPLARLRVPLLEEDVCGVEPLRRLAGLLS
ncbi:MAG: ArsA family ATPase [Longimicrobiaceae bacterium]